MPLDGMAATFLSDLSGGAARIFLLLVTERFGKNEQVSGESIGGVLGGRKRTMFRQLLREGNVEDGIYGRTGKDGNHRRRHNMW